MTVRLVDVEPFTGLVVVVGALVSHMDEEARAALSVDAASALADVETILVRLTRARVEQ